MTASREKRLSRRAALSDRSALRSLYEEYSDQLFAVAYRLTESSADARDVVHDVFGDLPKLLRRFNGKRPLGPWLRSVTARAVLKHLRSERRRHETTMAVAADDGEVVTSPEFPVLNSIAVERALSSLTEELRTVVVLKEIEGCTHEEIAEVLDISRSTSESRLHNARKLLRAKLFER
ncbi:MAG: sigma-70 family RNA polymerase sigma factor [Gemmatimonadetes bacterium]|nr:sigma-70 family RNA polymerase sigma factor [Candidatus Palauibacter rhopaloidicola]